ncbi:Coenzyme F420 hydrogenase/dehydrogenase, beta subunit C-terminal domain [Faecalibacterium prausnitzii]|jgi:acetyltransferase-like isoleucine patch superfamily enzyme/coenzyme F420-reducing hydrogenase beta subunit|uniref:Coenzyme F420 hydrogenase/dehydrogenase, beta subunit C-terminal domain n=1 Tax=Faecalibacterium prausnitzii TaxID=853 RepID=UPI000E405339|nr:Coenzyme F420 hydrogenase/dehydrogenase, beta subunit C-terminal domain [Faecalibacterium prausnitzii]RGC40415.1 4Fe-4S dicluster domain-containing protein [Faecalibacterium prausnitzii]
MIDIKRKEECCGCNACGDICPRNAISFKTDEEGFWYPVIDNEKCIDCGMCDKVCPIKTKPQSRSNNVSRPKCFAAEHKSIEVVFNSTTGGMFSALAEGMYSQKGYVGGAIHNEDFSVSHFVSNSRSDLQQLRRSKDLQSNAEGFYKKVKSLLENGERVLVCGVPCQIAALQNYVGKNYDNLITVDLVCAGVNSPKVWRKYLDYIEEKNGSKIIWTENKSKEYGWNKLTQKFIFENGEEYFDTDKTSLFTHGYIVSHLYCRPSCYECEFKGFPRIADITIGDFWGITKHSKNHNSNMGTNLVMINSSKGQRYFDKIKKRVNIEETPLEWALSGNPALTSSISRLSDKRAEFFEDLEAISFDELVKKYDPVQPSKLRIVLRKIKSDLKFFKYVIKITRLNPKAIYQTIKYSGLRNLVQHKGIVCGTNCHFNIAKSAELEINGLLTIGCKDKFPRSKLETRVFLGKKARLNILGDFKIDADCEIVVFNGAELTIHGSKLSISDANSGLRIICGEKIELMPDVGIGRNVVIRDTNGEHFMNTAGYKPTRPITIGEKTWLCEACTIMPGVKIGRGVIVGAHSMVTRSIPAHALVSGSPASVVQDNVLWKL